jgi:hypothetical protein
MADIVNRLREYRVWNRRSQQYDAVPVVCEAADEIERLSEHINQLQAKLHCMCGSAIDHSPWDGHQPVSMFDHAVEQEVERRMQALVTRDVAPHNYVPSAMHMGDCNVCGNLRDHPIHRQV